ncbi:hypothetical protein [Paenibacillus dauci]|uniref:hypothetical protein n=1 Tax=Paenibacillus dauci TaxID=1567106 RepID=UPI000619626B|nr:hypothetical protein [Paenibacillus dauci]
MNTLTAKRPSGSRDFIGILLNLVVLGSILASLTFTAYRQYLYYTLWIVLVLFVVYSFIIIRRRMQKPFLVQLDNSAIRLGNQNIKSADIQQIWLNGYERPLVGIQSRGRRILPSSHCFVFTGDEEISLEQLSEWAGKHDIQVVNKPFLRWI